MVPHTHHTDVLTNGGCVDIRVTGGLSHIPVEPSARREVAERVSVYLVVENPHYGLRGQTVLVDYQPTKVELKTTLEKKKTGVFRKPIVPLFRDFTVNYGHAVFHAIDEQRTRTHGIFSYLDLADGDVGVISGVGSPIVLKI